MSGEGSTASWEQTEPPTKALASMAGLAGGVVGGPVWDGASDSRVIGAVASVICVFYAAIQSTPGLDKPRGSWRLGGCTVRAASGSAAHAWLQGDGRGAREGDGSSLATACLPGHPPPQYPPPRGPPPQVQFAEWKGAEVSPTFQGHPEMSANDEGDTEGACGGNKG